MILAAMPPTAGSSSSSLGEQEKENGASSQSNGIHKVRVQDVEEGQSDSDTDQEHAVNHRLILSDRCDPYASCSHHRERRQSRGQYRVRDCEHLDWHDSV